MSKPSDILSFKITYKLHFAWVHYSRQHSLVYKHLSRTHFEMIGSFVEVRAVKQIMKRRSECQHSSNFCHVVTDRVTLILDHVYLSLLFYVASSHILQFDLLQLCHQLHLFVQLAIGHPFVLLNFSVSTPMFVSTIWVCPAEIYIKILIY